MPDLDKYAGREQGFVKHVLIEKYLQTFAIKISNQWDKIIYLDAFAGPWENTADDLSDTSFCIALNQLKSGLQVARDQFRRNVTVQAYLIEKNTTAFQKLAEFGEQQSADGLNVTCYNGAFEEQLANIRPELAKDPSNAFLFALIDPKGWSGLSMELIAPLLRQRSAEVLVNVMTSFIRRFAEVENCHDSYEKFFGRDGVREIIANAPPDEREDIVVREYCRSLRQICGFKHLSSAVVLQPDKQGIKYFMVFGTNNPMGIKVFKEAESHAASLQDQIKYEKESRNQLSIFQYNEVPTVSEPLRETYRRKAFKRVLDMFEGQINNVATHMSAGAGTPNNNAKRTVVHAIPYPDIFCAAMSMPLVTEKELLDFIKAHDHLNLKLDGNNRRIKPSIKWHEKHDWVVWER